MTLRWSLFYDHYFFLSSAGCSSVYLGFISDLLFLHSSWCQTALSPRSWMEFAEVFCFAAWMFCFPLIVHALLEHTSSSAHPPATCLLLHHLTLTFSRWPLETLELALLCICPLGTAKFQVHMHNDSQFQLLSEKYLVHPTTYLGGYPLEIWK